MMFQSYALFPHMTVEGNIAFGLKQEGMPKAEIAERVDEAMAMLELRAVRQAQAGPALRRPAAARGARPRASPRSPDRAARRAARRARQEAARGDAVRADEHPGDDRHDLRHRHPRPGRGDDGRDRIAVMDKGELVQVGDAGRNLREPEDALHRRLHRRREHVRGQGVRRCRRLHRDRCEGRLQVQDAQHGAGDRRPAGVAGAPAGEDPHRARRSRQSAVNAIPGKVEDIGYLGRSRITTFARRPESA